MSRTDIARRLLTLLLLVPFVSLAPLAYASPPDQTWIDGFYDDADYDDVILLALSLALVLGDMAPTLGASPILVARLGLPDVEAALLVVRPGGPSRAPPLV
jgi:hypothetical protein